MFGLVFCLSAQLSGNQNVRVVGTSYRITWAVSLFPARGGEEINEVKYKRVSSIMKSLHNKPLSSFVTISMSLSLS